MVPSDTDVSKVLAWLKSKGYPLEMRVSQCFHNMKFSIIQSDYYKDSDGDKAIMRETDVVAYRQISLDDFILRLKFVVECKGVKGYPWVLFSNLSRGLAQPAAVAQRCASFLGKKLLFSIAKKRKIQELSLFKIESPYYGGINANLKNKDNIKDYCYEAMTSVSKASYYHAIYFDKYPGSRVCEIVFPLIVVDCDMYSAKLVDDEVVVREISHGSIIWRNPIFQLPHTIIDIVNYSYLSKYVEDAKNATDSFFEYIVNDYKDSLSKVISDSMKLNPTKKI